mmetsp:Transcript_28353/g.62805  ORF Transcript_28353/g.62805 Transcript_28353/m.62805 type:complete len:740 (-) Transcript_28353:392-2611(-)
MRQAVLLCAVVAGVCSAAMGAVLIQKEQLELLNSETLPGNLLPNFMFQQGGIEGGSVGVNFGGGRGSPHPFTPDDSCGDDIFEGAMEDMRSPQLPYLTQDQWTCARKAENVTVWTMQDGDLKVTITPQWGGRVWSLFDQRRQKDVLFNNRAHQPANIGALKSWAAGGAEWNWSPGIIGHSAFSEAEVFMGRLDTKKGPVLRVWEFDRYNGTVWSVDMLLTGGAFVVHPRVSNPTDKDLRGYWWTCVAVDAAPSTRIYTPATHVAETSRDPMRDAPWPFFAEAIENASFQGYDGAFPTDNSYLGNHQIGDMFLRIPADQAYTPYIAHNNEWDGGYTLVHGHPLNGTKFYTWGQSGPGRFMQDFLTGGGKRQGDYAELQVGPAPTQMQNFPVPANSQKQWTEWFKGFEGEPDLLRGEYADALGSIDQWIRSDTGMDKASTEELEAFFQSIAATPVDELLVQGQPWGALEEKLLGHPLDAGLTFSLPQDQGGAKYDEMKPWLELLEGGFSESTLARLPLSYQTTDRWLAHLEKSAEGGMTWLHALHLGIAYAERGEMERPLAMLSQSMSLRANPIASRCLAVLQATAEEAWPYFLQAWVLSQSAYTADPAHARLTLNLVTEISFLLQQEEWWGLAEVFVKEVEGLQVQWGDSDAYVTLKIKLSLQGGRYSQALESLGGNCFPTYAKARDDLMSMWAEGVEGVAGQKKGAALSLVEKHQARMQHPVPDNIGCQYASEYCLNYW